MLISVILPTYNAVRPLAVSLRSFAKQTDSGFEVVVADDGSTTETGEVVKNIAKDLPFTVSHARQDDNGFRLARARNLAIARSRGDYIILIDGDCFVLPDFVARHRSLAEPSWFVSGKRSWLRKALTERYLDQELHPSRPEWLMRVLFNQATRPFQFIPLPNGRWRYRRSHDWRGVQTCNLAVWRRDLIAVNGFDNRYRGHGLEDSDFVVRLIRNGTLRKMGDHSSPALHLWHEPQPRETQSPNQRLFNDLLESERIRVEDGLSAIDPTTTGSCICAPRSHLGVGK